MGGIIWLASYPKSGNTWIRTFINNLILNPKEPADINNLSDFAVGDSRMSWYEEAGGRPYHTYSMGEVMLLRPKVHELIAKTQSDKVFVKTHSMFGTVAGVPLITMEHSVAAIYIIRNPLDVVISMSSHFGLPLDGAISMLNDPHAGSDEAPGVRSVRQSFGSWSGHANTWTYFQPQPRHTIRYEDMLDNPEETFSGVAKFIGISPSDEDLARAIEFSSFDVVRKQEEEKGFKEQSARNNKFFRVGKAGQWKDVLSNDQVDRIVECHHDAMKRYGYLP